MSIDVVLLSRFGRAQMITDKAMLAELRLAAGGLPEDELPAASVTRLLDQNCIAIFRGVVVAKAKDAADEAMS